MPVADTIIAFDVIASRTNAVFENGVRSITAISNTVIALGVITDRADAIFWNNQP